MGEGTERPPRPWKIDVDNGLITDAAGERVMIFDSDEADFWLPIVTAVNSYDAHQRCVEENAKLKGVLHLVDQLMEDCTKYGMPETESIRYRAIRERVREALGRPL